QCSSIHVVGRTYLYYRFHHLVSQRPMAASSISGRPVNVTTLASGVSFGVRKKFIGHRGMSECLKLRHQFRGKKSSSEIFRQTNVWLFRYFLFCPSGSDIKRSYI